MTRRVLCVNPQTSLQAITVLFDRHRIGRVPVVRDGRMVGIVASADLVKALSQGDWMHTARETATSDESISAALFSELRSQDWWPRSMSAIDVSGGIVRFTGYFESEWQRQASCVAAENIPGVQNVVDERRPMAELPAMF
jgi:CBS domain-containing protein